jgi:hypothetical protein
MVGRGLGTAVADPAVEIHWVDAMLAESVFERGATGHPFGCARSHRLIVVLLSIGVLGNRCAALEREIVPLARKLLSLSESYSTASSHEPCQLRPSKLLQLCNFDQSAHFGQCHYSMCLNRQSWVSVD